MNDKSARHLEVIRDGASFILEATRHRTLAEYESDRVLRQAVERNFEIIGEAVTRLRRDDPTTADAIPHAPPNRLVSQSAHSWLRSHQGLQGLGDDPEGRAQTPGRR